MTKLRTTGASNTGSGTTAAPVEETLAFVRSLANMPVTEYTGEVLTTEQAMEEPSDETPAAEPEEEAVPETEALDESAITIDNPEPVSEEPTSDQESEITPEKSNMGRILWSFFNFFHKRP